MLVLPAPHRGLTHLTFSPCGRLLAGGGNGPGVTVWDVTGGPPRHYPRKVGRLRSVRGLAFHPADGWLSVAGGGGLTRFDPTADPPGELSAFPADIDCLSPDGGVAVACRHEADAGFVYPLYRVGRPGGGWVAAGDLFLPGDGWRMPRGLLPDGRLLVIYGGGVFLHPGGDPPDPYPPGVGSRRVVVGLDGRAAFLQDVVGVWRPGRGWAAGVAAGSFADAAFHPDGQTLLAAGHDGVARLLDAESLAERAAYQFGVGRLRACGVAPDGLTAAVASATRVVLFDLG